MKHCRVGEVESLEILVPTELEAVSVCEEGIKTPTYARETTR